MLLPKTQQARRGSITVLVAVTLIVLLTFTAIALDGGALQSEKRHAQSVADAAALAAAADLYANYPANNGTDPSGTANQAALACASKNGYTNDGTHSIITVSIPPVSGPYQGKAGYTEVVVTYYQQRGFSGVLGSAPLPVRARAVSRGAWFVPNMGVLVLDYQGKGTLNAQGNGAFTESGAPVIVNSNNPTALVDAGNGTTKAPEFDITGGYSTSGNGQMVTSPVANNILTGVHPTPDPLAYLPVPDQPPAGTMTKNSIGKGNFQYTLSPGTYQNLPNFSSGDVVLFQQASAGNGGVFYLSFGGLSSQGASLTMDPSTSGGIMIYNAGTGQNDGVSITGNPNGTVNLSALTNGPYTGVCYFQARNAPEDINIKGNGNFTILGTLYAAGALLNVQGNGIVSNIGSQYVTQDLAIAGNGNVHITWQGLAGHTRSVALVE